MIVERVLLSGREPFHFSFSILLRVLRFLLALYLEQIYSNSPSLL